MKSQNEGGRSAQPVIAICVAITVLDGLDLLMFSSVLPSLLETKQWGMTTSTAGFVGSLSLVGMAIGASVSGYIADLVGRRPVILSCVAAFSIFTFLGAFANSEELFGGLRLLAGIGFGGCLPTVIALVQEFSKGGRKQFNTGLVQIGFPIGGTLAALAALLLIPHFGWRSMFILGGALGAVLLAVGYRWLPESVAYLQIVGRREQAEVVADKYGLVPEAGNAQRTTEAPVPLSSNTNGRGRRAFASLFLPGYRTATVLFWTVIFLGLLLSYGLNTWTPQILREVGFSLNSALLLLFALNIGNIIGVLLITRLCDRWGSRRAIGSAFACGSVCVLALSITTQPLLAFVLVILIGFFLAAQSAMPGFVGVYYPVTSRSTAIGTSLGIGRVGGILGPIITGLLVASALGPQWIFYLFAGVGILACLLVRMVPNQVTSAPPAFAPRDHQVGQTPSR